MANINRIKAVLVEQNKTGNKWLADKLGKSICTISKWCQNAVQPDINPLGKIAILLHVDIRDLLVPAKIED